MKLDQMTTRDAIRLMLKEEAKVARAVSRNSKNIEVAVEAIARALSSGGRLFYVGAGTSGRLAMLDATECPPTFSTPPEMFQCILAGGKRALWSSLEGAEDDATTAAKQLKQRRLGKKDVVLGITASGTTPFVWGALNYAKSRRACSLLLTFNPFLRIPRSLRPKIVICPNIGPEVLTGSTRLKAGTATKLILNVLSTMTMVRLGKVRSNLMIDVAPANEKLRARAVRIYSGFAGIDPPAARDVLQEHHWHLRSALADAPRAGMENSRRPPPKSASSVWWIKNQKHRLAPRRR